MQFKVEENLEMQHEEISEKNKRPHWELFSTHFYGFAISSSRGGME